MNLTYLNISKFHYITIVKKRLSTKLEKIDGKVKKFVSNTPWYRQLKELSDVDTIELEWPNFTKKLYISSPGIWGALYNVFFYWRFGKIISIASTVYCLYLLFLGVAHTAGVSTFALPYFNANISRHFWLSVVSALWPILCVAVGEYVCIAASRFVKYQTDNLQIQASEDAERALENLLERLKET